MNISPEKRDEVMKILKSTADRCRDYPGCISCHVYENIQEKNVFMMLDLWKTEESLKVHVRSNEYLTLLLALELSCRQPEIRIINVSKLSGMETIEVLRSDAMVDV
jgi:quinol monooxygenase YgiN